MTPVRFPLLPILLIAGLFLGACCQRPMPHDQDGRSEASLTAAPQAAPDDDETLPTYDVKVRQALNYAVDVDAIIENLLAGALIILFSRSNLLCLSRVFTRRTTP